MSPSEIFIPLQRRMCRPQLVRRAVQASGRRRRQWRGRGWGGGGPEGVNLFVYRRGGASSRSDGGLSRRRSCYSSSLGALDFSRSSSSLLIVLFICAVSHATHGRRSPCARKTHTALFLCPSCQSPSLSSLSRSLFPLSLSL